MMIVILQMNQLTNFSLGKLTKPKTNSLLFGNLAIQGDSERNQDTSRNDSNFK